MCSWRAAVLALFTLTVMVVTAQPGSAQAAAPTFDPPVSYPAGEEPQSIAIADFDQDGRLDLAVANRASDDVSVFLGTDEGLFGPATSYAAGVRPEAIATADVNGDGDPDLAIGNGGGNSPLEDDATVSVLVGGPGGSFGDPVTYPLDGLSAKAITTGDFNGDGDPDIAVITVEYGGQVSQVWIFPGGAGASFGPPLDYAFNGFGASIASADFNGDDQPDLVLGISLQPEVAVLLSEPGGTFTSPVTFPTASTSSIAPIAVGDLNSDGNLDLVVAGDFDVSVLSGVGGGVFDAAISYATGVWQPTSIAVHDFNDDEDPDLVVVGWNPTGGALLLGATDGSVSAPIPFDTGGNLSDVVIADFDGDVDGDLAAANHSPDGMTVIVNSTPLATVTTVATSVNPAVFGQSVTFTATVTAAFGHETPTGDVTFLVGDAELRTVPLNQGSASVTAIGFGVGDHTITAQYSGAAGFEPSKGQVMQTVVRASTTTTLMSSPNPSALGKSVTFTATVSVVPPGGGEPTGTVTFYDGGEALATATVDDNQASFSTDALASGVRAIIAAYSGDANFNPSVGQRTQTITHTLTFFLHGNDIPGTAGGFTMNQTSGPGQTVTLNLLSVPSWFTEPIVTGTFLVGATFQLVMPCTLGLGVARTLRVMATNPAGGDESLLGEVTQGLSVCLGQETITIPVTTPVRLTNHRLKLTLSSAVSLNVNLKMGNHTFLEATNFVGSP
ncbi:MAG: FG-GAP-like repeat-containing protein [Vicinamibacteraceae bacterium]